MLKEGEIVVLYKDERRNYLVKICDRKFHTDKGFIDLAQLREKRLGESIETNVGETFFILKPCVYDLVMKVRRETQIIYPKDIGIILTKATLFPGARVIEVGSGSGALTTALATFVGERGKVYSYERSDRFLNNAKRNLEKNGLLEVVEFKHQEVTDRFEEEEVDFIMIDIGSPWELVSAAYKSLKPGYKLATICPSFEQLSRTVFTLQEEKFVNIETIEVLMRRILVRKNRTRPEQRIPSHTGYLTFAAKTITS